MALVESSNGTALTSGVIIDKNGTPWSLALSDKSGLQILIKGNLDTTSANVAQLLYWDHGVYHQNLAGQWYKRVAGAWKATTDPRMVESANGSTLATTTGSLCDHALTVWTLFNSGASGLQIVRNGIVDTTTGNVKLLLYWDQLIYQQNIAGDWWYWKNTWIATSDPRLVESANGASLTSTDGSITDVKLVKWTLVSSSSGLQTARDGVVDASTANIVLLLYWNHSVYQQNSNGGWWYWNNAWVAASDPRAPAPSGKGVNVSLSSKTGAAVPATLFGIGSSGDMSGNKFAITNSPAWLTAAQSLKMSLYRPNFGNSNVMGRMFAHQGSPDWSCIDTLLSNLPRFFDLRNGRLLVTLGGEAPGWINIYTATGRDQFADLCVQIATRFATAGVECFWWELWNEPDGIDIGTYCALFNATSSAMKSYAASRGQTYHLGGPTDTYLRTDRIKTFATNCRPDFLSYHQYITGPGDGSFQPGNLSDTATVLQNAISRYGQAASDCRRAVAGTPGANVPIFMGEWNIVYTPDSGGGNYNIDPRQVTNIGAVFAALALWSLVDANQNVAMGALWELYADTYYGVIRPDFTVDPQGLLFTQMASYLAGQQVAATVGAAMKLKALATTSGTNFCLMLINYDTTSYGINLAIDGLTVSTVGYYEISGGHPTGLAQQIAANSLSNLTMPAMSVVFISNQPMT